MGVYCGKVYTIYKNGSQSKFLAGLVASWSLIYRILCPVCGCEILNWLICKELNSTCKRLQHEKLVILTDNASGPWSSLLFPTCFLLLQCSFLAKNTLHFPQWFTLFIFFRSVFLFSEIGSPTVRRKLGIFHGSVLRWIEASSMGCSEGCWRRSPTLFPALPFGLFLPQLFAQILYPTVSHWLLMLYYPAWAVYCDC